MSRHVHKYDELTVINVLKAYLIDGISHREIQKNILDEPAPNHGGGYIAMDILHHFGVLGKHKAILANKNLDEVDMNELVEVKKILKAVEVIEEDILNKIEMKKYDISEKSTELSYPTKVRLNQNILRNRVLKNYSNKCALCGINKSDLLVCSHVVPWSVDIKNRLNPENAICLCSLHDSLFDKGYISFNSDFEIIFSKKADEIIKSIMERASFRFPIREQPAEEFLIYHRKNICDLE